MPDVMSPSKQKKKARSYTFMTREEHQDTPNAEVPVSGLWEGLKERSTSHGIPHIDTAPGKLKRGMWCLITLTTIGALIFNLEEVIKKYARKDVNVIVKLYHANQQTFPAVTFCNMNPFKSSNLQQNADVTSLLGINNTSSTSRKRRKRAVVAPSCDCPNYHTASGLCFAMASTTQTEFIEVCDITTTPYQWLDGTNGNIASSLCPSEWEYATIDAADKYNFIKDNYYIFTGLSGTYWINGMEKSNQFKWNSITTFTFTAWKTSPGSSKCVYGDITDSHKWGTDSCGTSRPVLCQKLQSPAIDCSNFVPVLATESTTTSTITTIPTTQAQTPSPATPTSQTSLSPTTTAAQTTQNHVPTTAPTTQSPTTTTAHTTQIPAITTTQTTQNPITTTILTTLGPSTTTAQTTQHPDTTTAQTSQHPATTTAQTTQSPATTALTTQSPATTTAAQTTQSPATTTAQTTQNPATTTAQTTQTNTPVPLLTTMVPPPVPAPVPVPGSVFSERVQSTVEFTKEEKTFEALANIPEEEKKSLGYSASDFIVDCQYAGYKCDQSQFEYFYNSVHGNCYVFNSGWNTTQEVKLSKQLGPRYGLKVVLNIDQAEYVEQFGSAAGVRVVVHAQEKMPFPEDEGILARTGYLTSVGVTKVSIKKLGHPYTKCTVLDSKDLAFNVYEELYGVYYSTLACFKTCYQRYVISDCGCSDPGYPSYGAAFDYVRVKSCNSSNIVEDDCKYNITKMYAENKLECNCQDPCVEDVFVPELSESRWPSDMSKDAFIARHLNQLRNIVKSNDSDKLRDNLAKIEVYFQAFDFEKIEEKPTYSDLSFMTDIGGSLGLWIGWSFITAFEFMEFFIDLIVLVFTRKFADKVNKSEKNGNVNRHSPHNSPRPSHLPRRSMSYIHQDITEAQMMQLHRIQATHMSDTAIDSGIGSSSSAYSDMSQRYSRSRGNRDTLTVPTIDM